MLETRPLIAELDIRLNGASRLDHSTILRRVTDLFVEVAERLSDDHVVIFDDVINRLIQSADQRALIELSSRLAVIDNAPRGVIDRLARHDDVAVAGPVLQASGVITETTLVEIARTRSERHLLAVAGRSAIGPSVTDILVDRGSLETARKVADNKGATLSELAFVKLINRAKNDKGLAEAVEGRTDLPPELEPFLRLTLA
jgi:uncharacterized protein (DUF2336 family)